MTDTFSFPDFVDNSEEDLRSVFREQLQQSGTARIATGYFRLSGFAPLTKEMATFPEGGENETAPVRILMGRETNQDTADEIESGQSLRERLLERFDAEINEMEGNETQIKQIDRLRNHIAAGRVALRVRDPDDGYFHAKGASFRKDSRDAASDSSGGPRPATAVIGTSNFTQRGHVNNVELNLVTDDQQVAEMYESWFDSQWAIGTEATEDVLKIIEDNQAYTDWKEEQEDEPEGDQPDINFGSEIPPFEMFKLLAYDELDGRVEVRETPLFEFQLTGYELARKRLNKYGGCILSDSVGLGKSYIGSELLRDYRQEGKRCLLIVPANIEEQWASLLEEELGPDGEPLFDITVDGTHIKIMSISKFQNLTYHGANGLSEDFDVVLVDEGHRFRNHGKWKAHPPADPDEDYVDPRRHANLKLFHENDMIILSATPVNNSATDLKNLIDLFTSAEELINKGGVRLSVLDDYQDEAERRKELLSDDSDHTAEVRKLTRELRDLSEGEINDLLEEVLVQRNRNDIEDQISESEAEAFDFDFTPPGVHPEEYDLPRSYQPVYDRLPDVINALHLPHITIANEQSGGALRGLYKLSLFKRLESSTAAFVDSVETIYDSERSLFNAIEGADDSLSIAAYADELVEDSEAATEMVHRTLEEFGIDAEATAADAAALTDGGVVAEDGDMPEWAADLADVTVGEVKTYIREDLALLANFLELFIRDIIADDAARREVSDGWAHLRDWLRERGAQRIPSAENRDVGAMAGRIYPQSDLEGIGEASERFYEAVFWAESFRDPKLGRLADVLNGYAGEEKVLIFSEFQTTAEYLHDALTDSDSAAPLTDRNSAVVTGNSSNKHKTIKRLAPEANNYTDAIKEGRDSGIDFVIATDTLSEGVNAQDVNVVVNYDLPWNPTRIVQRVGRVDRIGSDEEKNVHNFFPDGDIEAAITLLERLQAKIDDIALLVGKENNILDPSEDKVLEQVGADTEKTIGEAQLDEVREGVERIREADTTSDYDAQSQIPLIQTGGATEEEAFNRILLRDYLTNDESLGLSPSDFEFADQYLTTPPEEREQLYTVVDAGDVTQQRGVAALLHQCYEDKEAPQFGREDREMIHTPFGDEGDVVGIDDLRRIAPPPDAESGAVSGGLGAPTGRIDEELEAVIGEMRRSVRQGGVTGGREDMPKAQEVLCETLDQIGEVYDLSVSGVDDPEALTERASSLKKRLAAVTLTQHSTEYRELTDRFGSDYVEWSPERVCDTVAAYLDETIEGNPDYQTTLEDPGDATGSVPCWLVIY